MAGYCHGPNAPYGCGHHAEHVEAAKKGWITRRKGQRGAAFEGSEEQRLASLFLGEKVSLAHTHPEHQGRVVFKSKGKWYELPQRQFKAFVRGGREAEREQQQRAKAAKKQTRQQLQEELYQERISEREGGASAFRADLVKTLSKGGIRATGKHDRGEVRMLPGSVRRSRGKYTLDQARELADELSQMHGAGISFDIPDDLVNFFDMDTYRREQAAGRRRRLREEIAALRTPRKRKVS